MDGAKQFEKWAKRAREDQGPTPDVTARVMRTLARPAPTYPEERVWPGWVASAVLVAATLICVVLGAEAWEAIGEPLGEWTQVASEWWSI